MQWIYLDHNATTRPDDPVIAVMDEIQRHLWANPSSVHRFGQQVRQRIELARKEIADFLGVLPRELIFTSGGTEANNLALRSTPGILTPGILDPAPGSTSGGVLITPRIEHAAIREPAEALAKRGSTVAWLDVSADGLVDIDHLDKLLAEHAGDGRTVLVSVQWANNETGVLQPIDMIAERVQACRQLLRDRSEQGRLVFHSDATQAVGKVPVDLSQVGVDLLTFSGHKFHGPKGAGALVVRRGVRLRAQQHGGPQERELRGGTEHVAGIIGLGKAVELARQFLADNNRIDALKQLRDRFEQAITTRLPNVIINSGGAPRLWNTSNLGFTGLEAEAILLSLSERGVCASAGAACSSGSLDPSPVLLAMGVPEPIAHGSVRFSLGRDTTDSQIDQAIEHVVAVVEKLGKTLPVGR